MFDGSQGGNRLIGCLHPFKAAQVDCQLEEGLTIEEMIIAAGGDRALMRHGHCHLIHPRFKGMGSRGMIYIPRENWARVRPKPGFTVQIRIVPTGGGSGGKDPLRIILSIAVLVVAAAATWYLGPAGALGAYALSSTQAALVGAGIGLAGVLFIGTELTPP
jgi:hypothetical protein